MQLKKNYKIGSALEIAKEIGRINGVKAVYLFGSFAKGRNHHLSDIDICIIGEKGDEKMEEDALSFFQEPLDISFFWKLPASIQFRVFKEGKALVINDKNFIDKVKIRTLRNYVDIKPLFNRYYVERFQCTI